MHIRIALSILANFGVRMHLEGSSAEAGARGAEGLARGLAVAVTASALTACGQPVFPARRSAVPAREGGRKSPGSLVRSPCRQLRAFKTRLRLNQ